MPKLHECQVSFRSFILHNLSKIHNLKCKCGVQVEVPVMRAQKATHATHTVVAACAVFASARIRLRHRHLRGQTADLERFDSPPDWHTQNYETLYPLGPSTGLSSHGQFHSYLKGLIVGELALRNGRCHWCHV